MAKQRYKKYRGEKANDDLQAAILTAFGRYQGDVFKHVEASWIDYDERYPSFAVYLYGKKGDSLFTGLESEDFNLQAAMDLLKAKYDLALTDVEFRDQFRDLTIVALIFEVYNVTE